MLQSDWNTFKNFSVQQPDIIILLSSTTESADANHTFFDASQSAGDISGLVS